MMPSKISDLIALRELVRPFPIVLITGGAGYIGSHAILEILKVGCAVIVVDNLINSHMAALIRVHFVATREYRRLGLSSRSVPPLLFHKVDLCDQHRLSSIFEFWQATGPPLQALEKQLEITNIGALAEGAAYRVKDYDLETTLHPRPLNLDAVNASKGKIIAVMHFAALKAVGDTVSHLLQYYQNNITGLLNLLECMTTHNVYRLVCSSTAVAHSFGKDATSSRITAKIGGNRLSDSLASNPYLRSKRMAEEILYDCCIANPELEVVALRYPNATKSHPSGLMNEDPRTASSSMLSDIPERIHVEDVANGHLAALRLIMRPHFIPNHRIYSLGTAQGYWGLEIIKAFASTTECDISFSETDDENTHLASTAKPITGLSWEADFDVQDMCLDIFMFATENPDGYERLRKLSALASRYPAAMRRASITAGVWQMASPTLKSKQTAFLKDTIRRIIALSANQSAFDEMCDKLNAVGDSIREGGVRDSKSIRVGKLEDHTGRRAEWSPLGEEWHEVSLPIRTA